MTLFDHFVNVTTINLQDIVLSVVLQKLSIFFSWTNSREYEKLSYLPSFDNFVNVTNINLQDIVVWVVLQKKYFFFFMNKFTWIWKTQLYNFIWPLC